MHKHNPAFKHKAKKETPEPTQKHQRRRIKGTDGDFWYTTRSKYRTEEETPCVSNNGIKITEPTDQLRTLARRKPLQRRQGKGSRTHPTAQINELAAVERKTQRTDKRNRGKCNELKYILEICDLLSKKWGQVAWTVTAQFLAK